MTIYEILLFRFPGAEVRAHPGWSSHIEMWTIGDFAIVRNICLRRLLPSHHTQALSVACAQRLYARGASVNEWVLPPPDIGIHRARQEAARARRRYDKADHALKRALRKLRKVSVESLSV